MRILNLKKRITLILAAFIILPFIGITGAFAADPECLEMCDQERDMCRDACEEHVPPEALGECLKYCGKLVDDCIEDCEENP